MSSNAVQSMSSAWISARAIPSLPSSSFERVEPAVAETVGDVLDPELVRPLEEAGEILVGFDQIPAGLLYRLGELEPFDGLVSEHLAGLLGRPLFSSPSDAGVCLVERLADLEPRFRPRASRIMLGDLLRRCFAEHSSSAADGRSCRHSVPPNGVAASSVARHQRTRRRTPSTRNAPCSDRSAHCVSVGSAFCAAMISSAALR